MKMHKIGVIGGGDWGKNLIRVFNDLGALDLICDSDPKKIAVYREKYPGIKTSRYPDRVIADGAIDAVIIATPAVTHYRIAKKALLNGKDVFVEKPIAMKVEEGEDLVRVARETGRTLMVGHILNYHPAIIKLEEMIREGVLGKIQHIYSNRLNIGKLRTEENILWSFAPHDISVMLRLVGKEPLSVTASGGNFLTKGVHDVTVTNVEFDGGVVGHIFVSWLHPFKEQKLVVVGSKAMAVFDDVSKEKLFIYPHKIEWKNGNIPVAMKAEHYTVPIDKKEPLVEEAKHFIRCITKKIQPQTDGTEGLKVLRLLERAEESIMKNNSVKRTAGSKCHIHPTSFIDENVSVGPGTRVWHFSHILKDSVIGNDCVIGQNVSIGPEAEIGNRCKIQNNVSVYKAVKLEDDVFCGPSCVFTNVYTPRAFVERKDKFLKTLVKRGATIGANATIVCGVTIGRYAFVGAGAVVKHDVPDYALVTGVPAKQTGWACKCGVPLKGLKESKKVSCKECGSSYTLKKGAFKAIREKV